jgi:modulator of FtsH protease HflK
LGYFHGSLNPNADLFMPNRPDFIEEALNSPEWNQFKNSWKLIAIGLLVVVLLAGVYSSYYIVQPEEEAVVKRFGKVIDIVQPGLHFKLPFGMETATMVPTARVLKEEFGFRSTGVGDRTQYQKDARHREESLMLTGDLKVIDVEWVVQYRVADPNKFLHVANDPRQTLRDISEAVMRRIVGNSLGSDVLTEKRVAVSTAARLELQDMLDQLDLGVAISTIELQDVTPPELVKPAFNEVNQAEQERERMINEAEKRRNQVIPRAEGEAKQIIAEAEGYAARRVNQARGEAERFQAILAEYQNSSEVTRKRMFLEMIDEVLPRAGKVIVMDHSSTAPVPFFNIQDQGRSGDLPPPLNQSPNQQGTSGAETAR